MRTIGMLVGLTVGFLLLLPCRAVISAGLEAEMVIYNGKILTADSPDPNNFSTAQAVAIYDGKFIAVGTNEQALQYAGPGTRKIDVGGRVVLPGLVESHNRIQTSAPEDPAIAWTSKEEGLAQLRTLALRKKPGEWINTHVRGGQSGQEAIRFALAVRAGELTRFDLDKVAPNNPVNFSNLFFSPTGDRFVNTKALEPLLDRTKYPELPGIHRDANGVPNGWIGGVADRVMDFEIMPPRPLEEAGPADKKRMEEAASMGIVSTSARTTPYEMASFAWLHSRGELPIRMAPALEASARSGNAAGIASRLFGIQLGAGKTMWGLGDDKLWVIGLAAISIDSTEGIGGSCISKTYPRENPNYPLWLYQFYGPHGMCRMEDPNYRIAEEMRAAAKYGFRITGTHAAGDRALDKFMDVVEELSREYPDIVRQRWGVDHCRFISDAQATRAKKLGLLFSCHPISIMGGTARTWATVGWTLNESEDVVVPLRRLIDHGLRPMIHLADETLYPFWNMEASITRKNAQGHVVGPQQRVSRAEALYMYTRWSAEYVLREDRMGSVEPKKYADLVVLDRDYLTVAEDDISQIDSVLTVVGGQIAYSQPEFAASQGLPVVGYQGDRSQWQRSAGRRRGAE